LTRLGAPVSCWRGRPFERRPEGPDAGALPIACRLVLGSALGVLRPATTIPLGIVGSIALGVMATVLTGELRISWEYFVVDIPLVACAGVASMLVAGRARRPRPRRERPR
jgi:hypothetical protein